MSNWKKCRLGDICYYGKDRIDVVNLNKTNYISTENMFPDRGGITEASNLPTGMQTPYFEINDTLVSNIRPYFKKVWKAAFSGGCSADVLIFKAKEVVEKDFLYYIISNDDFFDYCMTTAKGTKMPRGDKVAIMNYSILLPPLSVQRRITAILSALDDKIELNNRINANLEQQAQMLFNSWFVDFEPFGGVMPNDWFLSTFDNIVEFQNGYAFKSNELLNTCSENCLNVFKQGHINRGGGFKVNGTKSWIHQSQCLNLQKFILHRGDVLMAMTDMKDNVAILGNTAIMPYDNQYILNQRVGLLRPKKGTGITYAYIYILTNSDSFLSDLRSRANSGVQVNLSAEAIKSTEIIIATQEINSRFCDIITPMMEHFMNNQIEIQRLAALRDALLPKLMSGEISV